MRSRKSCFKALGESIRRFAPAWVLCGLTGNMLDVGCLEKSLFAELGGKNDAEIPVA